MSIYLMDFTTFDELFEFDSEQSEGMDLEIQWTERPVETGATLSDYRVYKPEVFPVEGHVTNWPMGLAHDSQRIGSAISKLRTLAKRGNPVWLITDDIAEEVVLGKVSSRRAAGEGDMAAVSLECRIVETTTPTTTTVPASRLKASVKTGSALRAKGGSSQGGLGDGLGLPKSTQDRVNALGEAWGLNG